MRTLQAQRLKKRTEHEHRHHREIVAQIREQAESEAQKLAGLLTGYRNSNHQEASRPRFEEYREDDEAVYFEKGFVEW